MYARELKSEQLYTLAEARKILEKEKQENTQKIKEWVFYKLLAALCIAVCLIIPQVMDGDATAWFIFIPSAIYFLTKRIK